MYTALTPMQLHKALGVGEFFCCAGELGDVKALGQVEAQWLHTRHQRTHEHLDARDVVGGHGQ